jgi:hypothetical protein
MMAMAQKSIRTALLATAVIAPAMILTGCNEEQYLSRRDTVTLGAGDAQAVNSTTHTIDPWSPHSRNTQIHQEGERARVAVDRYQNNKSIEPQGLNTTSSAPQKSSGGQGSTLQN